MKSDEADQFNQSLNYPAPFFIQVGPGYVRVLDADEMAYRLEDMGPEGYLEAKNMNLYVKVPFDEELVKVSVSFEDHGDHTLYEFIDVASGELVMMPGGTHPIALMS